VLQVGPARVGDVICFEVAYDGLVRSTVVGGAQLLTVQTNNATFGRTPETEQQLAMSRLRAVEHGRWVLVAATSGVSATIAPDGTVVQRAEIFTAAQIVQRVRLSDSLTPADRVGALPEVILALLGFGAAAWSGTVRWRQRRRPSVGPTPSTDGAVPQ
jgi:apolipoprotein N-acyltransferase